jgi:oligopeptide transport system substrate-binding protein
MKIKKHLPFKILKYIYGLRGSISCKLMAISCVFSACHSSAHTGKKVFYYNEFSGLATLDPAFAKDQSVTWAVHQIYNTLVETDNELHMVPSIAKSWEVSPDKLTYRFHLRTDVYF